MEQVLQVLVFLLDISWSSLFTSQPAQQKILKNGGHVKEKKKNEMSERNPRVPRPQCRNQNVRKPLFVFLLAVFYILVSPTLSLGYTRFPTHGYTLSSSSTVPGELVPALWAHWDVGR